MNYSTWIIILSTANAITIFSGFPTGTKKVIILVTTACLLFIGFILRAVEKKKRERIEYKKQLVEASFDTTMDQVATAVAKDVHTQVEEEIEEITHHENIQHHDQETIS